MRFDYVKYDHRSVEQQTNFKAEFEQLESLVNELEDGRAKSLVFTKLEEAYMWVGKAIRDTQIKRNPATEQQEGRDNS